MKSNNLEKLLIENFQQFISHWENTNRQGELDNTLIVSVSDGYERAKVITPIISHNDMIEEGGQPVLELLLSKLEWVTRKFDNPLKWLRLEWVNKEKKFTWKDFNQELRRYKRNYFRSGIAYKGNTKPWCLLTEMELNANACSYVGGEVSYAKVNSKNLNKYIKSRHSSDNIPSFDDEMELIVFQTSGIFFDAQTDDIETLCTLPRHHGHREIPSLTPEITSDLIDKTTHYLANQVKSNGRFEYGHFPCFGRNINTYNTLRHASSVYSLIEGYGFCREHQLESQKLDFIAQQIESALLYLENNVIKHYPDNKAYILEINNTIKLGANAVCILALVKYIQVFSNSEHNPRFLELSKKLANGILAMQKPSGQFVHVLNADTLEVISENHVIYYDGEAVFGLMRLYGIDKDEHWINCVEKAFDYFIESDSGHNGAHDHWLSYCTNEMVIYRPEKRYFQFAVNNVKGFTNFIKNRITTYPTLLELSMAFHKMLLKLDEHPEHKDVLEGFDVKEFYEALHARANYLVNGFFFPEMAMFYKKPNTILHGCFIRHHAFRVRIDDVQHYLSGWVAYHELLSKTIDSSEYSVQNITYSEEKQEHKNIRKIVWGGDVNLGRRQHYVSKQIGFKNVIQTNLLKDADLSIVNLECVVSVLGEQGIEKGEGGPYYYRARPEMVKILTESGVNVVTCANNHSGDYGVDALMQQDEMLRKVGIQCVGAGKTLAEALLPNYIDLDGIKVAIFAADTTMRYFAASDKTGGISFISVTDTHTWIQRYKKPLIDAKVNADIILFAIHWGANEKEEPTEAVRGLGRLLIDLGVDAVLGTSAHKLQGTEIYKGKPIIYDAGDLLLDSIGRIRDTGLFELSVSKEGVHSVVFHPLAQKFGQTVTPSLKSKISISERYGEKCIKLNNRISINTQEGSCTLLDTDLSSNKKLLPLKESVYDLEVLEQPRFSTLPKGLIVEDVPIDAKISPISFGALKLVGVRVYPKIITQRTMLWVESYWECVDSTDTNLCIDIQAEPICESQMPSWGRGMHHELCDWQIPMSQCQVGKIYRDYYGLRPPYMGVWDNVPLQLKARVIATERDNYNNTDFVTLPIQVELDHPNKAPFNVKGIQGENSLELSKSTEISKTMTKNTPKDQYFIFFNNNLGENYAGIESAALKRSKLFIEKLKITPVFLTMAYNLGIDLTIEELKRVNKIPESFKHINLYQFYQIQSANKSVSFSPVVANKPIKRKVEVIKNGKKYITKFYNLKTGLISYIHYHDDNGERYRLDNFDSKGFLSRVCVFKAQSKERISEFFYRADGTLCFQKFFIQKDGKNLVDKIIIHDELGVPIEFFDRHEDFIKYLLEFYFNTFNQNDQVNVIVDRNVRLIDSIKNNVTPYLKMIPVSHTSHLEEPLNMQSNFRSYYFRNMKDQDGVIILTEQQRQDVIARCGDFNNTYCIPHVMDDFPKRVGFSKRIANKVIAVGRYRPEKNHSLMIRVFAKVVEKIPTATLDLYGYGPLESELKQLIRELNMDGSITVNPFTKNIYDKFSEARISLLTSHYEAFSLVVMESLACGCPVIANDIKYGPSTMIVDGENGYLIEKDDESAFVDKIVKMLKNEDLNAELSQNAYESSQRFSEDNVAPLWQRFIEKITE